MISQQDLEGIDAAWIAIDSRGQVAMFTTGGEGHVPGSAILSTEDAESEVLALPEVCGFDLLVNLPHPDDFVAFACRGFFAYDWSDVHSSNKIALGRYELQARPNRPLILTDLPPSLQDLASSTRLLGASFGSTVIELDIPVGT